MWFTSHLLATWDDPPSGGGLQQIFEKYPRVAVQTLAPSHGGNASWWSEGGIQVFV